MDGPTRTPDTKELTPPTLKAQLKIHKPGIPIRPVVNNRRAPTYKAPKKPKPYPKPTSPSRKTYTVENSTKLANDLIKITLKDSQRLITLDIKDVYVNIPIHEALMNTRAQLHKHDRTLTDQICTLLEAILNQELFHLQNPELPTHQRSSHGLPHIWTCR